MKIVGMSVVGPGEADRYLEKTLEQQSRFCDDVIIVGNNTDKKTEKMIKKYGFWFYRDDREWGKYQPTIKTNLLAKVGKLNPDWVLPLDSDETYDDSFSREELERLAPGKVGMYFYIINLWNEPDRYSRGLSFWNIRAFAYRPELGLEYLKKPLHCGLAPPAAYRLGSYVPHAVIHYGLMKQEDRQRKIERYERYDPQAVHKDRSYYEALKENGTKSKLDMPEILAALKADVSKMKNQKTYD